MTDIRILLDDKVVRAALKEIGRQAPFALATGITKTIQEAQRAMKVQVKNTFTLRGTESLFTNTVKAKFATKTKPEGNIRIEGPETITGPSGRISNIVLRHEDGGSKTSSATYASGRKVFVGGFYLPAKGARPPRSLYPSNIGAQLRRDASGKSYLASSQKGRKRVRGQEGREKSYFATAKGIYERRHFGSTSAVRLLWAFERKITLKPRLKFFATIDRVINERLNTNILHGIDEAIRTAFR
jgi:hypothetical protein